jgi:two-component system, LytTR family, response regulator
VRTLIADHEPRARTTLRHLCEAESSIEEVVVTDSGAMALEMIRVSQPDLLLLDVELKDMTGFEVLRSLDPAQRPAVIMVATQEKHAIEALRGGAVDCLTKPVGATRLAKAIAKAQEHNDSPLVSKWQHVTANVLHKSRRELTLRLMAENSHRLYFLAVEDIDYIEACGNYVLIHMADHKYVRRDTIKRLALELRDLNFEWIRRSHLVNLSRVAFAEKLEHGALAFTLTSGSRLVSKNRVRLECARIKRSEK